MTLVAHFGTFDVENYGDLLFPAILERRLGSLGLEVVHVSPNGGPAVWSDCAPTMAAEAASTELAGLAGVIVGGGNIIHAAPAPPWLYDRGGDSAMIAYPSLWLGAAHLAAKHNVPFAWNAPGVSQPISPAVSRFAAWSATLADYLAVRDRVSRARLRQAGVTAAIHVVPDTAVEVARLWPADELAVAYAELFSSRSRALPDRSVVFHLNRRFAGDDLDQLAARLDRMAHQFAATPILAALGPCHGDDELQREVGQRMVTAPLVIDQPRSPRQIAACIAHSEAYLGSSLHGLITACAFGRRGMAIVPESAATHSKFTGFLEQFHLTRWTAPTWEAAEACLDDLANAPLDGWRRTLDAATPVLDAHWQRIVSLLAPPSKGRRASPAPNDKRDALERLGVAGGSAAALYGPIIIDQANRALERLASAGEQERRLKQSIDELQTTEDRLNQELADTTSALAMSQATLAEALADKAHLGAEVARLCDTAAQVEQEAGAREAEIERLHATLATERSSQQASERERQQSLALAEQRRHETRALRAAVRSTLGREERHRENLDAAAFRLDVTVELLRRLGGKRSGRHAEILELAHHELASARDDLGRAQRRIEQARALSDPLTQPDCAHHSAGTPGPNGATPPALADRATSLTTNGHAAARGKVGLGTTASAGGPAGAVDIVVCVHNALDDVQRCLASVERHPRPPGRLIVVDDGSDEPCAAWLRQWSDRNPDSTLLRRESATGYTAAANRGLRESTSPLVVLLNSDTVVTPGWAEKLAECAASDATIGIVGPLSNAASYQSVPERFDSEGAWALNPLPSGWTVDQVAAAVDRLSKRDFPRVPFVNGFCLAIKREVIEAIGGFDETAFPDGYGEENDYALRAAAAGYSLAVADHAYVYHAKSRSYTHQRRRALGAGGRAALLQRHGLSVVEAGEARLRDEPALARLREALSNVLQFPPLSATLSVLFLLPVSGGGGGAHSVVQEAAGMRRLGINARVAILSKHGQHYRESYPSLPDFEELFFQYRTLDELLEFAGRFSVVVATIHTSVPLAAVIADAQPQVLPAYYIQDYEPYFFPNGSSSREAAERSYTLLPNGVLFAKTAWLCDTVRDLHDVAVHKVCPSLDHEVYAPARGDKSSNRVRVVAMVRPRSPRRGPERTMEVLKKLSREFGRHVDIEIFGCRDDDIAAVGLPAKFPFTNHGLLNREEVADVLRRGDVFLDLSDYQAFGRTGLEAMACGCTVVVPALGGTGEYAVDGKNALVVDTSNTKACLAAARRLVVDGDLRARLRQAGLTTAARYSIARAADSELRLFESCLATRGLSQSEREPTTSLTNSSTAVATP